MSTSPLAKSCQNVGLDRRVGYGAPRKPTHEFMGTPASHTQYGLYGTSSKGYENDTTLQLLWLFVCHVGQNQNCHNVSLANHTVCMVQHIPSKGISRSGWGRDWAGATPNRLLGSPSRDKGRMAQKVNAERPKKPNESPIRSSPPRCQKPTRHLERIYVVNT